MRGHPHRLRRGRGRTDAQPAGIEPGAKTVGTQIVGKVTKAQVEEIAKQKMPDLNCDTVESAMAQVVGSARSMGLQVVE
jgi:large subunit ribosomal protein L11